MDNTAEEARGETAPNPEKSPNPESKPGSKLESKPEYKPQFQPERRRLVRNLPSPVLFSKIRAAERRMEAGEREMGFYLLDLKRRRVYKEAKCSSFRQFVKTRTGTSVKKAADLVRVAKALELLPLMDEAFSRGKLYWSAVRAMTSVATPQNEAQWVEYAKCHRVDEVERRVAGSKAGEGPDSDWKGLMVRYPYEFTVKAEVHQAFESLSQILSLKSGTEVTVPEALFLAARRLIAAEIESDGKDGKERKLPSGYRMVIQKCPDCKEHSVMTEDGRVKIESERARELLEGAEVLVIHVEKEPQAAQKSPARDILSPEVLTDPHTHKNYDSHVADVQMILPGSQKHDPPLIQHAPNLSTPQRPQVPPEERDPPSTPELNREVHSRDGFLCRIPGCGEIATVNHHIEFRSQGGRTVRQNLGGLCSGDHSLVHEGKILLSGNSDGELKISDEHFFPLASRAGDREPSVELEVEPVPKPASPPWMEESESSSLPDKITAEWWRTHRQALQYSEKENAWVFNAFEELEVRGEAPKKTAELEGEALDSFVGQEAAVENLSMAVKAAKMRDELPPPILLSGPPGVGKTTLAGRVAQELKTRAHVAPAALFTSLSALVDILSSLREGDVLFIDEIHGIGTRIAECLYQALDEQSVSLRIVSGSRAKLVKLKLEPFVLVGATTEESLLPKPFHSRFGIRERLDFYSKGELEEIARGGSAALGVEITGEAARVLASGSRGTPRELHGLLRRARDLAQLESGSVDGAVLSSVIAERALSSKGIDPSGLSRVDRKLLEVLVTRNRPLGLRSLADLIGETQKTVVETYEPYLFREGYLTRTHRGRVATEKARQVFRSRTAAS